MVEITPDGRNYPVVRYRYLKFSSNKVSVISNGYRKTLQYPFYGKSLPIPGVFIGNQFFVGKILIHYFALIGIQENYTDPYLANVDPQRSFRTIERISLFVPELMSFIHFCRLVFSHHLFITGVDMSMRSVQLLALVISILPSFHKVFEFYNGSRFLGFLRQCIPLF